MRKIILLWAILVAGTFSAAAQAGNTSPRQKESTTLWKHPHAKAKFGGFMQKRLMANLENWELPAPEANPALVEMFYDRNRLPSRKPLPWSGEFVGKYLSASILSYTILGDARQKQVIQQVTKRFIGSQGEDGYLGAFDEKERLTGNNWDVWNHYWALRALILYHEVFGDKTALTAATRAADLLVNKFLDKGIPMTNDGGQGQMNYSVIHAFTKLYNITGKASYLDMAKWIVKEWEAPGAGRYISMAMNGYEMFEFPANRWESLHGFQGMLDMYLITGEKKYRDAFEHIWYSIQKGDRHNTGGFTTGEKATGNPYASGAIETCCTVAWIDMCIDMLKLTGNPLVADELELAMYNGLLGSQTPSGRWWTYSTPMDGAKRASAHEINFQCRPGSPELNCCSVNGPRGLALTPGWALLNAANDIVINYYGEGEFATKTPNGQAIKFTQYTTYPASGSVKIVVGIDAAEQFALQLRIPSWSHKTTLKVNGKPAENVAAGAYHNIQREWKKGDNVEIEFDMSPHYWAGERDVEEKTSMYYGPLLLAFDPVYNKIDADKMPEMNASDINLVPATTNRPIRPLVLFTAKDSKMNEVVLCDFMTAGAYGNTYVSWLPVKGVKKQAYSREKPVWVNRDYDK